MPASIVWRRICDGYLTWYYSLPAEYARLSKVLVGDLEEYMARELEAKLGSGDPFAAVEAEFTRILAADAVVEAEYREAIAGILARNRVTPGTRPSQGDDCRRGALGGATRVPDGGLVPLGHGLASAQSAVWPERLAERLRRRWLPRWSPRDCQGRGQGAAQGGCRKTGGRRGRCRGGSRRWSGDWVGGTRRRHRCRRGGGRHRRRNSGRNRCRISDA